MEEVLKTLGVCDIYFKKYDMETNKFYHIYNRGNNSEKLFYDDNNYMFFLKKFKYYLDDFVDIHAYCLMPNHFHFLISIKDDFEVSKEIDVEKATDKGFNNLFISYAKAINKRRGRTGSLFQNSYKKKEITDENYIINLILYIHQNPVVANLVDCCDDWKYSSYKAYTSKQRTLINKSYILSLFGDVGNFIFVHKRKLIDEL